MAGVFTGRARAVMAEHAIIHHVDVVKFPAVGRMALVTDIAAQDMPRVLALGDNPIVAIDTATNHNGVIDPGHGGPGIGGMAIITVTDDTNMPARRGAGLDTARVRMTVHASPRRANEYPLHVTGFAIGQGMLEIQGEIGLVMVKIWPEVQGERMIRVYTAGQQ